MSHRPILTPSEPADSDRQKYGPIVITIFCAALVAAGSCYGAMTTSAFVVILAFLFFLSTGTMIGAVIWLLVAFIINATRRGKSR